MNGQWREKGNDGVFFGVEVRMRLADVVMGGCHVSRGDEGSDGKWGVK